MYCSVVTFLLQDGTERNSYLVEAEILIQALLL
jgi:hypothetical protein